MQDRIVQCTADIIRALKGLREINVLSLSEYIGQSSILTYQALGWLACEGRIRYRQTGRQVMVSLSNAK